MQARVNVCDGVGDVPRLDGRARERIGSGGLTRRSRRVRRAVVPEPGQRQVVAARVGGGPLERDVSPACAKIVGTPLTSVAPETSIAIVGSTFVIVTSVLAQLVPPSSSNPQTGPERPVVAVGVRQRRASVVGVPSETTSRPGAGWAPVPSSQSTVAVRTSSQPGSRSSPH